MTVQDFVNVVTKNPKLLDLEIGVVTSVAQQQGGQLDGSAVVNFGPLQSVTIGGDGLLFWVNRGSDKSHVCPANLANWPDMAVMGQYPIV